MGVELPPSPVVFVLTVILTLIGSVYRAWNSAAAKLNASRAGWVTEASKVELIVNASAGELSANAAAPASNKEVEAGPRAIGPPHRRRPLIPIHRRILPTPKILCHSQISRLSKRLKSSGNISYQCV